MGTSEKVFDYLSRKSAKLKSGKFKPPTLLTLLLFTLLYISHSLDSSSDSQLFSSSSSGSSSSSSGSSSSSSGSRDVSRKILNNAFTVDRDVFRERRELLEKGCHSFNQSGTFPSLFSPPQIPGSDVVFIPGDFPVTVCIPRRVGSHAWSEFAGRLNGLFYERVGKWKRNRGWENNNNLRAVVVRHPIERLASVYRGIFESWCDPRSNYYKNNKMCTKQGLRMHLKRMDSLKEGKLTVNSLSQLLSVFTYDYMQGNDEYISRIWNKFNKDELNRDERIRFTFSDFVRLIVNGTKEFANDPYILKSNLSQLWAPYWEECPVCQPQVAPDFILHMETLEEDVTHMLDAVGLGEFAHDFPHTRINPGGHTSLVVEEVLGSVSELEKHELVSAVLPDLQLFGYSPTVENSPIHQYIL